MKNIAIYLASSCQSNLSIKKGSYCVRMEYKDLSKLLEKVIIDTTITSNRLLLIGLIEALNQLRTPCNITIYTPAPLGFISSKPNKDLISIVKELMQQGSHQYVEEIRKDMKLQLRCKKLLKQCD